MTWSIKVSLFHKISYLGVGFILVYVKHFIGSTLLKIWETLILKSTVSYKGEGTEYLHWGKPVSVNRVFWLCRVKCIQRGCEDRELVEFPCQGLHHHSLMKFPWGSRFRKCLTDLVAPICSRKICKWNVTCPLLLSFEIFD